MIQQKIPTAIPETLAKMVGQQRDAADSPDALWLSFVRELCKTGGRNFTEILDRSKPIPFTISRSLQALPVFPLAG
jgi:hypothetical protein